MLIIFKIDIKLNKNIKVGYFCTKLIKLFFVITKLAHFLTQAEQTNQPESKKWVEMIMKKNSMSSDEAKNFCPTRGGGGGGG